MEPLTRLIERRPGPSQSPPERLFELERTLAVTATYLLSENGRKASLLQGGNGRALQKITLNVPVNRLQLVSVDTEGVARLKLQPRFEPDALMHIVRIDGLPVYDEPPSHDELCRIAARNHELGLLYETERQRVRSSRREHPRDDPERRVREVRLNPGRPRALTHSAAARARRQPGELAQLAGTGLRALTRLR
jgi:hypothetical protein